MAGEMIGAGSGVLGLVGSIIQTNAANKQAEAQRKLDAKRWYEQMDWQRQLRGADNSPTTFDWSDMGRKMQSTSSGNAYNWFRNILPDSNETFSAYQGIRDQFMPYATSTPMNVMSGQTGSERLATLQPVEEARLSAAKTSGQAWKPTVDARLNAINALNRAQGFGPTGKASTVALADSEFAVRKQQADAIAQAILENAQAQAAMQQYNIGRQEDIGLQLPSIAQNVAQLQGMPTAMSSQEFLAAMNVLSPFMQKPSYNTIPYTPMQYIETTSPLAAGLAGASGLGTGLSNYFAQQQYQDEIKKMLEHQQAYQNYATDYGAQYWTPGDTAAYAGYAGA